MVYLMVLFIISDHSIVTDKDLRTLEVLAYYDEYVDNAFG